MAAEPERILGRGGALLPSPLGGGILEFRLVLSLLTLPARCLPSPGTGPRCCVSGFATSVPQSPFHPSHVCRAGHTLTHQSILGPAHVPVPRGVPEPAKLPAEVRGQGPRRVRGAWAWLGLKGTAETPRARSVKPCRRVQAFPGRIKRQPEPLCFLDCRSPPPPPGCAHGPAPPALHAGSAPQLAPPQLWAISYWTLQEPGPGHGPEIVSQTVTAPRRGVESGRELGAMEKAWGLPGGGEEGSRMSQDPRCRRSAQGGWGWGSLGGSAHAQRCRTPCSMWGSEAGEAPASGQLCFLCQVQQPRLGVSGSRLWDPGPRQVRLGLWSHTAP